ncbi:MAG: hypothetical protein Phyf2KO_24280 [Phycisphaerales bacterium]
MRSVKRLFVLAGAMFVATHATSQPLESGITANDDKLPGLEVLHDRADALIPIARTETGAAYLEATKKLPNRLRRYLYVDRRFTMAYPEAEFNELDDRVKSQLRIRPVTELAYYMGISERPLLDFLPVDLVVGGTEMESTSELAGRKILLYNPRVITQGWLLASLGADVTILHNQIRMKGLYSQHKDSGAVESAVDGPDGSIRFIYADWPSEAAENIGEGYDLVIVSDWISQGLSMRTAVPPRWVTPGRPMREMGSTPDDFLKAVAEIMAPGGRFINYAYGPIEPRRAAQSQPYSNVRSPYSTEAIAETGLELLVLDADDSRAFLDASMVTDYQDSPLNPEGVPTMLAAYTLFVKPNTD